MILKKTVKAIKAALIDPEQDVYYIDTMTGFRGKVTSVGYESKILKVYVTTARGESRWFLVTLSILIVSQQSILAVEGKE